MTLDLIDLGKIAVAIGSIIMIYLFRKKITGVVSDLIIGGDSSRYKEVPTSEILKRIDRRLDEVLR